MADGRRLEERLRRAVASFTKDGHDGDLPLWATPHLHPDGQASALGDASPTLTERERPDTTQIFGQA
jgi:hypothetical protein